MQTVPVHSTMIAEIGHDPYTNILEVRFHNGRIYHHFMVPRYEYEALMSAESIGAYFNRVIRPHYRSTRIDESLV